MDFLQKRRVFTHAFTREDSACKALGRTVNSILTECWDQKMPGPESGGGEVNLLERPIAGTSAALAKTGSDAQEERGMMMKQACVRCTGEFVAMIDHTSGRVIVKLDSEREKELMDDGIGDLFVLGEKRTFREWLLLAPHIDEKLCVTFVTEAVSFAMRKHEPIAK